MKAYKFNVKVNDKGTVQLDETDLFGKEVQIIVIPKTDSNLRPSEMKAFLEKWSGFLTSSNPEVTKYDYLTNKYK